jgi:Mycobacterium 19 kDa lipoprotein antigen
MSHTGRVPEAIGWRELQLTVAGAFLFVALPGCSFNPGPIEVTTVVVDGEAQTINGPVTCTAQPDGKLVILAVDGRKRVRVLLQREHQLVVQKLGFRVGDISGFTDSSADMWATKVDDVYTINGQLPSNADTLARQNFTVTVTCRRELAPAGAPQPGFGAP